MSSAAHDNDKCYLLNRAIRKYGREAFVLEEIANVIDESDLYHLEIALIAQENTLTPSGYNLSHGGRGISKHSDDSKIKIAQSLRGVKHSHDRVTNARHRRYENPMYGISVRDNFYRGLKKYRVRVGINGRTVHIGDYHTLDEAVIARDKSLSEV